MMCLNRVGIREGFVCLYNQHILGQELLYKEYYCLEYNAIQSSRIHLHLYCNLKMVTISL
jgi:hypothetical protein